MRRCTFATAQRNFSARLSWKRKGEKVARSPFKTQAPARQFARVIVLIGAGCPNEQVPSRGFECVWRNLQRDGFQRGGEVNDPTGRFPARLGPPSTRTSSWAKRQRFCCEARHLLIAKDGCGDGGLTRSDTKTPRNSARIQPFVAHRVHVTSPRRLPRELPRGWTHVNKHGKKGPAGKQAVPEDHGDRCLQSMEAAVVFSFQPEIIESNLANA